MKHQKRAFLFLQGVCSPFYQRLVNDGHRVLKCWRQRLSLGEWPIRLLHRTTATIRRSQPRSNTRATSNGLPNCELYGIKRDAEHIERLFESGHSYFMLPLQLKRRAHSRQPQLPNSELFGYFQKTVMHHAVQINGGYYCQSGIDLAVGNADRVLEAGKSIGTAAQLAANPAPGHTRKNARLRFFLSCDHTQA